MQEYLIKLASHLRTMQLFNHLVHHAVKGSSFFSDHEQLGEFYLANEKDYDSIVERFIGIMGFNQFNHGMLMMHVVQTLSELPEKFDDNKEIFIVCLTLEQHLQALCDEACKSPECTEGTKQLIGNIADMSEQREFLIKRRIK